MSENHFTIYAAQLARDSETITTLLVGTPIVIGIGLTHLYFNVVEEQRPGAMLTTGLACITLGLYAAFTR